MVLVKVKMGTSNVHGIGIFADQFIPKGTITWQFTPWFDRAYSEEELNKMSETAREEVLWYAYFDKQSNKYHLCSDDYRFIYHSSKKERINIASTPSKDTSLRDIQAGEELLCDYNKFDDTYFSRLGIIQKQLV